MLIQYAKKEIQTDENWQAAFRCAYCTAFIVVSEQFDSLND